MQFVADLHLHSKYSRAVSQQMTLPVMAQYAQQKGLDILSATDITHPLWFKEISNQLVESAEGIYQLKNKPHPDPLLKGEGNMDVKREGSVGGEERGNGRSTYFILSTEISSIYKQGEKLRRIHNLVFAPGLEVVAKINSELVKRGCNLNADGRPIIGLTSKNLLELILAIDERCFLIPCHVWTPHFGLYGSASGFESIEEAFGDLSKYIYGIETGLSSDPDMNWSIAELRNRSIISNSDAHSPAKMGRECTVFELVGKTPTFKAIKEAIMRPGQLAVFSSQLSEAGQSVIGLSETDIRKTGKLFVENRPASPELQRGEQTITDNRILYTIEFYPEEGKYHFSGHRNCKISYGPEEIREKGTVCPVCHRGMTEGVLLRVQQLADQSLLDRVQVKQNDQGLVWHTDKKHEQPPFVKLVPLNEIIAEGMHSTVASQKVKDMFNVLCAKLGSEIDVLLKAQIRTIRDIGGVRVAEGVQKVREGNILVEPGYDGEYGKVKIWREGEEEIKAAGDIQIQLQLDL